MANEKELKNAYLEAAKKSRDNGNSNTVYTFEMIQCLRNMAEWDVYPDGRFGDTDCNIWEMFLFFRPKKA